MFANYNTTVASYLGRHFTKVRILYYWFYTAIFKYFIITQNVKSTAIIHNRVSLYTYIYYLILYLYNYNIT